MFRYRKALKTDAQRINEFCSRHKVLSPAIDNSTVVVFVAEDSSTGEIIGVSSVKLWYMVEPVVGSSAHVNQVLLEKAASVIPTSNFKCVVQDEAIAQVLERAEFVITDKNMTILERGT